MPTSEGLEGARVGGWGGERSLQEGLQAGVAQLHATLKLVQQQQQLRLPRWALYKHSRQFMKNNTLYKYPTPALGSLQT